MIRPSNLLYPNEKEFYLIGYESLCSNPRVWVNIKDLLGINQEIKFLLKESKKFIGQTFDNNLSGRCY